MWIYLQPGSSPVDWCEGNYVVSNNIAEFANTLSNFLFLLVPPISIYLFQDYGRCINRGIHVVWALMIVIGLSSTYFHATLSLVGQLLDEVSILWQFAAVYALFFPKKLFPKWMDRKMFTVILTVAVITCTILALWEPVINAFALISLAVPSLLWLYSAIRREKIQRLYRLGIRSVLTTMTAIFCWILDKSFCDTILGQKFPYLHAIWHVLIFMSTYASIVAVAYYAVKEDYGNYEPDLRYWPNNESELGIPFVAIKCSYSEKKRNI